MQSETCPLLRPEIRPSRVYSLCREWHLGQRPFEDRKSHEAILCCVPVPTRYAPPFELWDGTNGFGDLLRDRRSRPSHRLGRIPLQIRMVAGYPKLVHRKEQLIAEARYVPNTQFLSIPFRNELIHSAAQVSELSDCTRG